MMTPNNSLVDNYEYIRRTGEYVQVLLCAIVVIFGLPVNLFTLYNLLKQFEQRKNNALRLLHINLNVTDILLILCYCMGTLTWFATGEWHGGRTLCLIMRFLDMFVFAANSNVLVCVAIDRLLILPLFCSVRFAHRIQRNIASLSVAWLMAFIFCLPQLLVWSLVQIGTGDTSSSFCIDVWTANAMMKSFNGHNDANGSQPITSDDFVSHSAYNLYQIAITFWLPFIALFVCYGLISASVYHVYNDMDNVNDEHLRAVYSNINLSSKSSKSTKCTKSPNTTTSSDALRLVSGQGKMRSVKMRSLRVTLFLLTVHFITWLPYNLLALYHVFDESSTLQFRDLAHALHGVVALNSLINPFLYGRINVVRRASLVAIASWESTGGVGRQCYNWVKQYRVKVAGDERN